MKILLESYSFITLITFLAVPTEAAANNKEDGTAAGQHQEEGAWQITPSPPRGLRGNTDAKTPGAVLEEAHLVEEGKLQEKSQLARRIASCSSNKRVKIYKFCINGSADSGAHGEHILRLDGRRYYPSSGYKSLREGQCHSLGGTPWWEVDAWKTLDVGTEEVDDFSANDSTIAHLSANDWYNPTCNPYEVKMSRDFESKKTHSVCWEVGAQAGNDKGSINAGIKRCTQWTTPPESYIWLMQVEPANSSPDPGWFQFKNERGRNYCMDLKSANAANGNAVQLYSCNGTNAQRWYLDSTGRIHSGVNTNKCLEAGKDGKLYSKMFVWDCHNGAHQRWSLQSDGRIRNKAYEKYIGVASGCSGVSSGRRLELHNKITDGCASQQKWIF